MLEYVVFLYVMQAAKLDTRGELGYVLVYWDILSSNALFDVIVLRPIYVIFIQA